MTDIADPFGIPEGTHWCPHCNGYGSSLKEAGDRCSHCAGTGLVVDDADAIGGGVADSARTSEGNGSRGGRSAK